MSFTWGLFAFLLWSMFTLVLGVYVGGRVRLRKLESWISLLQRASKTIEEMDTAQEEALKIAAQFGPIPGALHKEWVIDQMVRSLTGDTYPGWVDSVQKMGNDYPIYLWGTGEKP